MQLRFIIALSSLSAIVLAAPLAAPDSYNEKYDVRDAYKREPDTDIEYEVGYAYKREPDTDAEYEVGYAYKREPDMDVEYEVGYAYKE